MERIVISDTNILIDLLRMGLVSEFFMLPCKIHTVDMVIREGVQYYFVSTQDYVARSDQNFYTDLEVFPDANAMVRSFLIDGVPLLDIIDSLEDVDIL